MHFARGLWLRPVELVLFPVHGAGSNPRPNGDLLDGQFAPLEFPANLLIDFSRDVGVSPAMRCLTFLCRPLKNLRAGHNSTWGRIGGSTGGVLSSSGSEGL